MYNGKSPKGQIILRVNEQGRAHLSEDSQGFLHGRGIYVRKLLQTRVCQKALESDHAGFMKRQKFFQVPGDYAAQKRHVNVTLSRCGLTLGFERLYLDSNRDAIERHVNQRRDPACGSSSRRRLKALPLGVAGLVHVHMGIDKTWHEDNVIVEVPGLPRCQPFVDGRYSSDAPIANTDTARNLTLVGNNYARGPNDQVKVSHG